MKRVQKVGLKEAYVQEESVKEVVQCFFGLPLLPVDDISDALEDVRLAIPADSPHAEKLQQLARYVKRQWLDRRSVAHSVCAFGIAPPERTTCLNVIMPVCGSRSEVTHPNLFVFLTHLQKATADSMADMLRVRNGIKIRRAKKKRNLQNDTRIRAIVARYDAGSHTRMQFLRAISHSLGAHTDAFDIAVEITD